MEAAGSSGMANLPSPTVIETDLDEQSLPIEDDGLLDLWEQQGQPEDHHPSLNDATVKEEPPLVASKDKPDISIGEMESSGAASSSRPQPENEDLAIPMDFFPPEHHLQNALCAMCERMMQSRGYDLAVWLKGSDIVCNDAQLELDSYINMNAKGSTRFMQELLAQINDEAITCVPTSRAVAAILPRELLHHDIDSNFLEVESVAGARLKRCLKTISHHEKLFAVPVFKIGIAANPVWRWNLYKNEGRYDRMILLDYTKDGSSGMLESALIFLLESDPGIQNNSLGGERGPGRERTVDRGMFTYLVIGEAGAGFLSKRRCAR